jgi:hypothetical protein
MGRFTDLLKGPVPPAPAAAPAPTAASAPTKPVAPVKKPEVAQVKPVEASGESLGEE